MRHELPEVNEGDYLDAAPGGLRFGEVNGGVRGTADPALGGLRRAVAVPAADEPDELALADDELVRSVSGAH